MKYAPAMIETYSQALRAMNSSVPLSPPLISAALTRIETTSTTIAQNSVVLKLAFVSWLRSAMRARIPVARGVSTRVLPVAPVVAKMCSFWVDCFRSPGGEHVWSPPLPLLRAKSWGRPVAFAPPPTPTPPVPGASGGKQSSALAGPARLVRPAHQRGHPLTGALGEPDLLAAAEEP